MAKSIDARLRALEAMQDDGHPQQGELPTVVPDDMPAVELERLRSRLAGREVYRFSEFVDTAI